MHCAFELQRLSSIHLGVSRPHHALYRLRPRSPALDVQPRLVQALVYLCAQEIRRRFASLWQNLHPLFSLCRLCVLRDRVIRVCWVRCARVKLVSSVDDGHRRRSW